jgi:cytochrome c553
VKSTSVEVTMRRRAVCTNAVLVWIALAGLMSARADEAASDLARAVQPILANHCWNCHGPDADSREAGLRLDDRTAALAPREGGLPAIVAGDAAASAVVARIHASDDTRMPPDSFDKPLSAEQKTLLSRWIDAGAPFADHWALIPARRPPLPTVKRSEWPRGDLDRLVLARLEAEGLEPSPEADRATWLRRVTLDLTGLPPTPAEVAAFLADAAPEAHATVVDRLLSSPRHAERMAMQWLDVARYADTNGYNNDEVRTLWPWRDWVIRAFAENMPFDTFVTEQVAGDLLPGATISQRVATGFSRNHVLTTEGGIVDEEYRVEYVADRVHTTATAFLGLSFQCARCHDHKYDPLTQRDYYRFAAFFDNVPDKVVGYSQGKMAEPLLEVPSAEQVAERRRLEERRDELAARLTDRESTAAADQEAWEASLTPRQLEAAEPPGLVAWLPFDDTAGPGVTSSAGAGFAGEVIGRFAPVEGRLGGALDFDGQTHVAAGQSGAFEADQPFTISVWVRPTGTEAGTVLSKMDESDAFRGYDLILEQGKVAVHVVHHWPDRAFKVITNQPLELEAWHHLAVTYDGSRRSTGVRLFVDGQPQPITATTDNTVDGTIHTPLPFHVGRRSASAPFRGRIDEVRLYGCVLPDDEVRTLAAGETPAGLAALVSVPRDRRTPEQAARLRAHFLESVDAPSRMWREEAAGIPAKLAELAKQVPVTMVMAEMSPRRQTRLLVRGRYDQPGDAVSPGVPRFSAGDGATATDVGDRLALARWLTDPAHPLTARVAVNRWWAMLFGTGIVETVEDFGVQGAAPSDPQLLDWLATELVRRGWNVRSILREIVLSATYRQSSHVTPLLAERDPTNRLLARGPRGRLPAEMVRDNALAIGGLLVEKVGGPSVKPWQPAGLWEDVSVERRDSYVPDSGDGAHRRSLYTFWKRTCPPPGMTTFDAPDRETCVARRGRTNTPLQALVLMNDPTYLEAAGGLAIRVLGEPGDDSARIGQAWIRAVGRVPTEEESTVVKRVLDAARQRFGQDPSAAEQFLAVATVPPVGIDRPTLAAWTTVTSLILNLDETISKP